MSVPREVERPTSGEGRMVWGVLRAGLIAAPFVTAIAFLIRGGDGAASAATAIALVLANALIAAWMLVWAAKRQPVYFPMMAMPSYVVRMGGMLLILAKLRTADWIDVPTFAIVFGWGVLGSLVIEWRIWSRTPWIALTFEEQRS
jgi:hypothetical protein